MTIREYTLNVLPRERSKAMTPQQVTRRVKQEHGVALNCNSVRRIMLYMYEARELGREVIPQRRPGKPTYRYFRRVARKAPSHAYRAEGAEASVAPQKTSIVQRLPPTPYTPRPWYQRWFSSLKALFV